MNNPGQLEPWEIEVMQRLRENRLQVRTLKRYWSEIPPAVIERICADVTMKPRDSVRVSRT